MKQITAAAIIFSILSMGATLAYGVSVQGQPVYAAQDIICQNVDLPECDDADQGSVTAISSLVLNVLSIIIGAGSVLVIIIAGFMQVVSAGNPDLLQRSKNAIIYAIVGVVVAIFAQVIVQFVLSSV